MKKLYILMAALLALAFLAIPAMADDNVDVTVTVPTIQNVDFVGTPGDFSNIAGSELGANIDRTGTGDTVDYEANVSSKIVMSNTGINGAKYTLHVNAGGWLDTASGTLGTGLTGDSTIDITGWQIQGLDWDDGPISDTVNVLFTISNT